MTSMLQIARTVSGSAQAQQPIHLLGDVDTDRDIRAYMFRTMLFEIVVHASARPWLRTIYNTARDAAQDPRASLEDLRGALENIAILADRGRARIIHGLARDELNATYSVVGRSPAFGTARM